jgi:hypothetical protein
VLNDDLVQLYVDSVAGRDKALNAVWLSHDEFNELSVCAGSFRILIYIIEDLLNTELQCP